MAANGSLRLLPSRVQASVAMGNTHLAIGGSSLFISDQPDFLAGPITSGVGLGPVTVAAQGLPAGTFGLAATPTPAFP